MNAPSTVRHRPPEVRHDRRSAQRQRAGCGGRQARWRSHAGDLIAGTSSRPSGGPDRVRLRRLPLPGPPWFIRMVPRWQVIPADVPSRPLVVATKVRRTLVDTVALPVELGLRITFSHSGTILEGMTSKDKKGKDTREYRWPAVLNLAFANAGSPVVSRCLGDRYGWSHWSREPSWR